MGLEDNNLTTLPKSIENLKDLSYLDLRNNPINNLSNFPLCILEIMQITSKFLTNKAQRLFKARYNEDLLKYYLKSAEDLATQYIQKLNPLTQDEETRLVHESGKNEIKLLENVLQIDDPILKRIMERQTWKISKKLKIYL